MIEFCLIWEGGVDRTHLFMERFNVKKWRGIMCSSTCGTRCRTFSHKKTLSSERNRLEGQSHPYDYKF